VFASCATTEPEKVPLLRRACQLQSRDACARLANQKSDEEVPGANLRMGSITADNLTMTNVVCKTDGGGFSSLLIGPVIAGAFSKSKGRLLACKASANPRVTFEMQNGKIIGSDNDALGDARMCLKRVMTKVPAPLSGQCAATLVLKK
jgi:hypothetical protein